MFYDKNLEALKRAQAIEENLVNQLKTTAPVEGIEIYETEAGDYTLFYKGVYLHDIGGSALEARNIVENNSTPGLDRQHILFGIGMGYLLEEMYKASTGRIFIYEPDLPLLRFILENVDLSEYLGSGRVFLAGSRLELQQLLRPRMVFGDKIDVLVTRGSAVLLAEEIPAVMEQLVSLTDDRHLDYFTVRHFHYKWITQFFGNVHHFPDTRPMDDLAGKFEGKPALVVSRGPSLDKSIEDVKRLAPSSVVIAVGSAIRRLYQAGVRPDFAVFYDANGMKEQIHGIPEKFIEGICFLICPFTQELCYTTPSREKFLFLGQNNREYADWLDSVFGRKHVRVDGGGTVSLIAFETAMVFKCNPIVLVGQDLAFPNDQVYAGGIQLETNGNGLMTLKASDELYAAPETLASVKGQNGETLNTLKAYLSFIRHFEELAEANKRREKPFTLINTSIGGADIRGFNLMPLAQFAEQYRPEEWKHGHALDFVEALPKLDIKERTRAMKKAVTRLYEGVSKAVRLSHELTKQVAEMIGENSDEEVFEDLMPRVARTRLRFPEFLKEYPLIAYFTLLDNITYSRQFNQHPKDKADYLGNIRAGLHFLAGCHDMLLGVVLPPVERAKKILHGEPVDEPTEASPEATMEIEAVGEPHETSAAVPEQAVI